MGSFLNLPDERLLLINGAQKGVSGYGWDAWALNQVSRFLRARTFCTALIALFTVLRPRSCSSPRLLQPYRRRRLSLRHERFGFDHSSTLPLDRYFAR